MGLLPNLTVLFLYITSVFSQPFFTSFEPVPPPLIEWDQTNTTYYTGQTMQMNWTSQGFLSTDLARIQYTGTGGARTLTTGSGTSILNGVYSIRLSDASNMVATSVPLTIAHSTNTTNALSSTTRITIIQSKLMNIVPLDGNRTLGGGQNAVCDDRNLTVTWRGLGEAQFGAATVSLSRQGGGGGGSTLVTQSNIPISANNTVSLFCSRTLAPSTFFSYAFSISVQEPGGSAYTGTSASFTVAAAPSPTPSNTPTPTPSKTPTSSPSQTPSNTPSPSPSKTPTPSPSSSRTPTPSTSQSGTPTPSLTPSPSATPSTTPTAAASVDYAAIARSAAASVDTSTPAIAGAFGGIGGILILIGGYKWYQNKVLTEKRKKKLAMSARWVQQANAVYGIENHDDPEGVPTQPSIVMYTVANTIPRSTDSKSLTSIKKGFAPKPATK